VTIRKKGWLGVLAMAVVLIIGTLTFVVIKSRQNVKQTQAELAALKSEDQFVRNETLQTEIENLQKVFSDTAVLYEAVVDLRAQGEDVVALDTQFAAVLHSIGTRDYGTAIASAETLQKSLLDINTALSEKARLLAEALAAQQAEQAQAAQKAVPAPTPTPAPTPAPEPEPVADQSLPADGQYKQVSVSVGGRQVVVSMVAGDVATTRVVIDTATNGSCTTDCAVLPLASYVERRGAFAGVNGTYFCPATYPQCSESTNAFGLVVMNVEKTYVNEADQTQAYSAAIFSAGGIQFINDVASWGKSTAIDGLISNYPLLVSNGQMVFSGSTDPKLTSRSNRSFVGNVGNVAYIGTVHNVSVAESAQTLQAVGLTNALNLDAGGSTALWYGGYKLGPGRSLPNVILFIKR